MANLELIINGEKWTIKVENQEGKKYWGANTQKRELYISNYDLEKAKLECYLQYRR